MDKVHDREPAAARRPVVPSMQCKLAAKAKKDGKGSKDANKGKDGKDANVGKGGKKAKGQPGSPTLAAVCPLMCGGAREGWLLGSQACFRHTREQKV